MSWQDECVPITRVLINDTVSPVNYSDTQLEDLLVVCAKLIQREITPEKDYKIIVSNSSIDPDPVDDPEDISMITLMCLKAAYTLSLAEWKYESRNAISIVDGPSEIDMSKSVASLDKRVKQLRDDYEQAKTNYMLGNSSGCRAILTPYTSSCGHNALWTRFYP